MNIPFFKMTGAGNDFIFIDNRDGKANGIDRQTLITKTCARSISAGADGLVLIEDSDNADFKWRFYNSDGSEAEMCGNASRCAGRFAYLNGIAGEKMKFETIAGLIEAEVKEGVNVKVQLTEPFDQKDDYRVNLNGEIMTVSSINTGVPHVLWFVDDIEGTDIMKYGAGLRYHEEYAPKGTNVNLCKVIDNNILRVRTYERGVEGETQACGTGFVAAAIIAVNKGLLKSPVTVKSSSGLLLTVYLENGKVYLEGEARVVYKGELTEEAYNY